MTSNTEPIVKVQTWGDDLRLPCFVNTTGLLNELESLLPSRGPTIPFQSKHLPALKRNTWYVLKRPADRSRSGLLVIWPERQACIYISGEPVTHKRPTRVALMRLRIDPQFMSEGAGLTVFNATLSSTTRRLLIEDTLMWKGRNVLAEELFSARWALAVQWIEHYCLMDPRLISGLEIEMAKWGSLDHLRPEGLWELQPDEAGRKRFYWFANTKTTATVLAAESPTTVAVVPVLETTGPQIAIATRDSGPEQWTLTSLDGANLGRALIRTLAISERMRSKKSLRVEVGWNDVFKKWEIKDLSL